MWFAIVNRVLTHWRVAVVLAALLAAFAVGAVVNGWRLQSALEAQRADYEARLAAGWEASLKAYRDALAKADEAQRAADQAIRRMRKERDQWKQTLSQAIESDPDCAAWASQRVACPLPQ